MTTILSQGDFFGQIVTSHKIAEFFLNETVYLPQTSIPRHSHETGYFCLVRKGSYTEAFDQKHRACGPFTFAFHPQGELHSEKFGNAEVRSFNIEIASGWTARLRNCGRGLERPAVFTGGEIAGLAIRLYREVQLMDSASPLAIEGLILEIIARAARGITNSRSCGQPPWLRKVQEILHDRFTERLVLGEIASAVDIHPVHMAAVFSRNFKCTIGEYIRNLRIENACRQLTVSDKPLAEIAAASGFSDQSHFSRAVKKSTGMTPAQYRRLGLN